MNRQSSMTRYFLRLAYHGKNYCGWQIQPNGISVQETLNKALSTILREPVEVVGAGRTDAGVHAKEMYAHFDLSHPIDNPTQLVGKLNSLLPYDIAAYELLEVHGEAHARFDAKLRRYEYHISTLKSPFTHGLAYRYTMPLDFEAMNDAARVLFDHEDFTSFSRLHTDVKTNNCRVTEARWEQVGECWVFTIAADRFLRNMVRAIVGTLLDVGRGKLSKDQFNQIIINKNRSNAGSSAPAEGLYLVNVEYEWDKLAVKNKE